MCQPRRGGSEGFTSDSLTRLSAGGSPSPCGPLPRASHHAASPRVSALKERGPVRASLFYALFSEMHNTSSAVCCWSHRPTLVQCGRTLHKGLLPRRHGPPAAALETGRRRSPGGLGLRETSAIMCSCVVFFFLASLYPPPHFCFLR